MEAEIVPKEETEVTANELSNFKMSSNIMTQVHVARTFPRSLVKFEEGVLEVVTINKETAKKCWYSLPRGAKVIQGPSIRFAEVAASRYGNLHCSWVIKEVGEDTVTCEGRVWDLQENNYYAMPATRRIVDKYGKRYNGDMILMTTNACGAIALRNAIFKAIPQAVFGDVLQKVQKIAMGDERGITETRNAIFLYFKNKGVSEEKVLALINRKGRADVTLEDATTLRGLATAISEGATTVKEAFSVERSAPAVATISRDSVSKGDESNHIGPGEATTKPKSKPKAKAKKAGKASVPKDSVVDELITKVKHEVTKLVELEAKEEWITNAMAEAGVTGVLDECKDEKSLQKALIALENLRVGVESAAG